VPVISFALRKNQKTVIIIAGPTAVGKTSLGIAVAKHFSTEIISADSRQCFKELSIGVARPSEEELAAVPHHFIASHSILQKVTAATFEDYALEQVSALFQHHNAVVMVGGTGLYIKAFTEGMDPIPEVPQDIHEMLNAAYKQNGLLWLQEEVKASDPQFFAEGETQNPQRLLRALEVVKATGQSILSFRTANKKERPFEVVKLALDLPREILYQRINHRVELMMKDGLLEEVRSLVPYEELNALQTVGYKEFFRYFRNDIELTEAVESIKQNTRHYAKRQLTWFRKDETYHWLPPNSSVVLSFLEAHLARQQQ
jgi:tRNA dimethylallyltransferase